jgi:subtilisin-like proprotein convertase family protein
MFFTHSLRSGNVLAKRRTKTPRRNAPAKRRAGPHLALEELESRTLLSSSPSWAFNLGGPGASQAWYSTVDGQGNSYVGGYFNGTVDFDPGPGTVNLTSAGGHDGFLAKYSPQGTLLWTRSMGGSSDDITKRVIIDGTGNVYATGYFNGTADFGGGVTLSTTSPSQQAWVAKFAADTGNLLWAKGTDGGLVEGDDLAVDSAGSIYTTGYFSGTVDFKPGPGVASLTVQAQSSFVWKLDSSGNYVTAWRMNGNTSSDSSGGTSIAVDSGTVYVAGAFSGTVDFDPGPGTASRSSAGGSRDIFFASYSSAGALNWVQTVGGPGDDGAGLTRLALDGTNLTLASIFSSTADFDPGPGIINLSSVGGYDVCVSKYARADGSLVWAKSLGSTSYDAAWNLTLDSAGMVYVSGAFTGTVDFDPGPGVATLTGTQGNGQDGFLLELDGSGNYVQVWQFAGPQGERPLVAGVVGGMIYVSGYFWDSVNFPSGQTLTSASGPNGYDGFVLALNPQLSAISGMVFNDLNNDGHNNDGSALSGRTLYLDLNSNGVFDSGEPSTVSDVGGHYSFGNLVAGSYTVREVLPADWTLTAPAGGAYTVTLGTGQVLGGQDFGNYTPSTMRTYASGTLGLAISNPSTTVATLNITDSYTVFDVNVNLNISYNWDSDLTATLTGPDGTVVTLFSGVGGSMGKNFTNTTLDDESATAIGSGTAPFTGSYQPQMPLSAFDNKNVQGTWTLRITDSVSKHKGTLNNWSLQIVGPTSAAPLVAAGAPASNSVPTRLAIAEVKPLVQQAEARWQAAGVTAAQTAALRVLTVQIADLGGATLALAYHASHTIRIDDNAAGWGWFVDPTPRDDSEFTTPGNQGEQGKMDLLTVLAHEMGHLLGLEHTSMPGDVMDAALNPGMRLMPTASDLPGSTLAGAPLARSNDVGKEQSGLRTGDPSNAGQGLTDAVFAELAQWLDRERWR